MDEKQLGAVCREARLKRGLGVNQLAKILKFDGGQLSRFERGLRRLPKDRLTRLTQFLEVEVHFVIGRKTKVTCEKCLHRFLV